MISDFIGHYDFLSNFYHCKIDLDGIIYPSVEHAYQAAKILDPEKRLKIRDCKTAAMAKKLGRMFFIRDDWNECKIEVMRKLLEQKFTKGTYLANKLIETGEEELVEGNWWQDVFWGQCPLGNGQNWLGRLLMEIRENINK